MARTYTLLMEDEEMTLEVSREAEDYVVRLGDQTHRFRPLLDKTPIYSFLIDGLQVLEAEISFNQDHCEMNMGHVPYTLELFDPRQRIISQSDYAGGGAGQGIVSAPMPGKVVEVKANIGMKIKKGETVVIVEAMKMQNELHSPLDGKVSEVYVKAGDTVESGQKLAMIIKES